MIKKIFMLLLVVLSISVVSAQQNKSSFCEELIDISGISVGAEVPSILPYKNEQINIFDNYSQIIGGLETSEGLVQSFGCVELENPTLLVTIKDLTVIDDIVLANNSIKELNNKILNEEILVEGVGFGSKFKVFSSKVALRVVSWFN